MKISQSNVTQEPYDLFESIRLIIIVMKNSAYIIAEYNNNENTGVEAL